MKQNYAYIFASRTMVASESIIVETSKACQMCLA